VADGNSCQKGKDTLRSLVSLCLGGEKGLPHHHQDTKTQKEISESKNSRVDSPDL
jgi:hypothetical protein